MIFQLFFVINFWLNSNISEHTLQNYFDLFYGQVYVNLGKISIGNYKNKNYILQMLGEMFYIYFLDSFINYAQIFSFDVSYCSTNQRGMLKYTILCLWIHLILLLVVIFFAYQVSKNQNNRIKTHNLLVKMFVQMFMKSSLARNFFKKIFYLYIFRERGREGEKRETLM